MSKLINPDSDKYGRVLALQHASTAIYEAVISLYNLIKVDMFKVELKKDGLYDTSDNFVLVNDDYTNIQKSIALLTEVAERLAKIKI